MNINLHIDSIVLDGLDLSPGQTQLLQQAVASELTTMLMQQRIGSSLGDSACRASGRGSAMKLGRSADASTIAPQVAKAIYASIPRTEPGSSVSQGGHP